MAGITLAQAEAQLASWLAASTAVAGGQAYTIGGRSLTRADARSIQQQIDFWDKKCQEASGRIERVPENQGLRRNPGMKYEARFGSKTISVEENLIDRAIRYLDRRPGEQAGRCALLRSRGRRIRRGLYLAPADALVGRTEGRRGRSHSLRPPTLRERSRDLLRNEPLAVGAVNTVVTNVVGTGLTLKSQIDRDVLKMTEEQADAWEAQAEREWHLFFDSPECDLARTLNGVSQQELALRQVIENGDVFVLMPNLVRPGSPYGMKMQMIEGDRVCNKDGGADGDAAAGGVERDSYGAPVRYHILDQHPGSAYYRNASRTWATVPAFGKTGRRNVIHLFKTLRPGQSRGVPYLAPVIEPLKQLGSVHRGGDHGGRYLGDVHGIRQIGERRGRRSPDGADLGGGG